MYDSKIHYAHAVILLAWILPYFGIIDVPQFIAPFIATVIFIVIDVSHSRGYFPFNEMLPMILGMNLLGLVFSTAEYGLTAYRLSRDYDGIYFETVMKMYAFMDAAYLIMMGIAIGIGFIVLTIKKNRAR